MERQSFVFILQRSVLKFLTLPLLVSSIAVRASVHRTNSSSKFKTCAGVSSALIAKMRRNENVSTNSLMKICTALNCYIGDIIEIVPTVRGFFAPFRGDGALPGLLFSLPLSGSVPVIQRSGATKNLSSWGRKIPRQARDDTGRSE